MPDQTPASRVNSTFRRTGSLPSIREMFDDALRELGVDVFSLLVDDRWQVLDLGKIDGVLVPQEVDSHLYYPEVAFGGAGRSFYDDIAGSGAWWSTTDGAIEGRFVEQARSVSSASSADLAKDGDSVLSELAQIAELVPAVRTFYEREEVESVAIFRPGEHYGEHRGRKLLFLNFRTKRDTAWLDAHAEKLAQLAAQMMRYGDVLAESFVGREEPLAVRTVRALAGLSRLAARRLREPMDSDGAETTQSEEGSGDQPAGSPVAGVDRAPGDRFYNELAELLHASLLERRDRPPANASGGKRAPEATAAKSAEGAIDASLIVSIYLLKRRKSKLETPFGLKLVGSSVAKADDNRWNEVPFPSKEHLSITALTTATGMVHVLQRVDRNEVLTEKEKQQHGLRNKVLETSLRLTEAQFLEARNAGVPCQPARDVEQDNPFADGKKPLKGGKEQVVDVVLAVADEGSPGAAPSYRLIVRHTPLAASTPANGLGANARPIFDAASIELQGLFGRWPALKDKLERRLRFQYAHVFGRLDHNWEGPCSEICAPIRLHGAPIGCINIESKTTDRFRPTYVGVLMSFATAIAQQVTRRTDLELERAGQAIINALHGRPQAQSKEELSNVAADPATVWETKLSSARGSSAGTTASGSVPLAPAGPPDVAANPYGLNEYTQLIADACQADHAFFVSTPTHIDEPFRFISTTNPSLQDATEWRLPRSDGWLDLLKRQGDDVQGLILTPGAKDTDEAKASQGYRQAAGAWWIKRVRPADPPDGNAPPSKVGTPAAKYTLPTVPEEQWRDIAGWPPINPRMLICIRLPRQSESETGQTLLWMCFQRAPFSPPPLEGRTEPHRQARTRRRAINRMLDVARGASGKIDHWRSGLMSQLKVQDEAEHGRLSRLQVLAGRLYPGDPTQAWKDAQRENIWMAAEAQLAQRLRPPALLARLERSISVAEKDLAAVIRSGRPVPDSSQALLSHRLKRCIPPLDMDYFGRIVDKPPKGLGEMPSPVLVTSLLAHALYLDCREVGPRHCAVAPISDRELRRLRIVYGASVALFIITQAVRNARKHNRRNANLRVEVCAERTDAGLQFEVRDNGCGFLPRMLAGTIEFNRRLPFTASGGGSLGLDLMQRAARSLNPDAPAGKSLCWGNLTDRDANSRGAYVQFLVPNALLETAPQGNRGSSNPSSQPNELTNAEETL